jgi:hypothetical protein
MEENWRTLVSLFPTGWQQMARDSDAILRFRGLSSCEVLLRLILLHVGKGYSLRETVLRAKLARWADISDVPLLKSLRKCEEWLRCSCYGLLTENCKHASNKVTMIRVVDGTVVKEQGKTGSQWRILYMLRLPSLTCDFLEVTSTIGEGNGETLSRLPISPDDVILADAGYCSVGGFEHVQSCVADVLVRINPQSFVAFTLTGTRISLLSRLRTYPEQVRSGNGQL